MALTSGRNTVEIADGKTLVLPVKANTKIYEGGIVMVDSGYAVAGKKATGLITAGRAEEFVDNTGAGGVNGAKTVKVRRGVFKYNNDTTNPVTKSDVLKDCYVLDDDTVTILNTGASKAGKIIGLDDDQVIIEMI
jgi:putative NADPH-quinone reductase